MQLDKVNERAVPFLKANKFKEAAEVYEQALVEAPGDPALMNNLANIFNKCGRWDDSIAMCGDLISKHPHVFEAFNPLGQAHWCKHDFGRAMAAFQVCNNMAPDFHISKHNFGTIALMHRMWEEGWWGHEFRFAAKGRKPRYKKELLWDGEEALDELTVWGEQGIGDEVLQFGMARDLLASGKVKRIYWQCEPRLVELFRRAEPRIVFEPRDDRTYGTLRGKHFPASSLGRLYRNSDNAFPTDRDHYLFADPLVTRFNGRKIVGISWHSKRAQYTDWKSSPLSAWAPVVEHTTLTDYYTLQYGHEDNWKELQQFPQIQMFRPLDTTNDITKLASLIAACDIVVTVSNTTAHLACALGIPTIVLLPNVAVLPWCWGIQEHTPWYLTATVMRMQGDEGWQGLLTRAATKMEELL